MFYLILFFEFNHNLLFFLLIDPTSKSSIINLTKYSAKINSPYLKLFINVQQDDQHSNAIITTIKDQQTTPIISRR
jgi:hypothetical protein